MKRKYIPQLAAKHYYRSQLVKIVEEATIEIMKYPPVPVMIHRIVFVGRDNTRHATDFWLFIYLLHAPAPRSIKILATDDIYVTMTSLLIVPSLTSIVGVERVPPLYLKLIECCHGRTFHCRWRWHRTIHCTRWREFRSPTSFITAIFCHLFLKHCYWRCTTAMIKSRQYCENKPRLNYFIMAGRYFHDQSEV